MKKLAPGHTQVGSRPWSMQSGRRAPAPTHRAIPAEQEVSGDRERRGMDTGGSGWREPQRGRSS